MIQNNCIGPAFEIINNKNWFFFIFFIELINQVRVKLLYLDCCVRRTCWSFTTSGMRWVAQDEMVILLEQESLLVTAASGAAVEAESEAEAEKQLESLPPADVFYHLLSIYEEALNKHQVIVNLGHTVTPGTFLGQYLPSLC